ncbi:glycosyltransferase family 2 protein, partial [Acidisoma sp. L85]|uniref:glycosyltransferase family 2 protein n=1 Tax=Acidisoma sp. L85 TaxID=1641850 RepID=UPI001C20C015
QPGLQRLPRLAAVRCATRALPELRNAMEPVAVVIPTLNEAGAIAGVIREIPREFSRDIIVADSGSTDGTQQAAIAAGARVIDAGRGYGRACAMAAESADPSCTVIVFLDGDGADRADLIGLIAGPVLRGSHDFVLASRTRGVREPGAMLWHQVLAGRVAGLGMGMLYHARYSDMCAFRAIERSVLERLDLREMTYGWNLEMQMRAARSGLRILEVPLPYRCRTAGESKVAGSLRGTMRAGGRIAATFFRVAMARS